MNVYIYIYIYTHTHVCIYIQYIYIYIQKERERDREREKDRESERETPSRETKSGQNFTFGVDAGLREVGVPSRNTLHGSGVGFESRIRGKRIVGRNRALA